MKRTAFYWAENAALLQTCILVQPIAWKLAFHWGELFSSGGCWFPYTSGTGGYKGEARDLHASLLILLSCLSPPPPIAVIYRPFSLSQRLWYLSHSLTLLPKCFHHPEWLQHTQGHPFISLASWFLEFLVCNDLPPTATTCSHSHLPTPVVISKITDSSILLPSNMLVQLLSPLLSFVLIRTSSSRPSLLSFLFFPYPA